MVTISSYSAQEDILSAYLDRNNKERNQIALNMRNTLAQRNANNIWGNGFNFESKNEELVKGFKKLNRNNRLNQLFYYMQIYKSLYGRAIITMNKNKNGDIMLNLTDPWFFTQIGKVFVTEVLAVVWQRLIVDSKSYYLKSTYTTEYVENDWYFENEEKKMVLVFDQEQVIPKQFQVEKRWNHNLGFLPLIESYNYPYRSNFYQGYDYISLSDWYNSAFLEEVFIDTLKNLQKEIAFCHSRMVMENMQQAEIEKYFNQNRINPNVAINDYIISSDIGGKVYAIAGNGDFTKYTNTMNELMDFYFKFSNTSKFSEGGGAQKSSNEVTQSRSNTVETIKQKITANEEDIELLIFKCLCAMEICDWENEDLEFQIKINGNIQRDDTVYLDNIIKQVQLGTMSIVEAIGNLRNVDNKTAESIFEEIQNFNEENNIVSSMSGFEEEVEEDNFGGSSPQQNGGRPADKGVENGDNN